MTSFKVKETFRVTVSQQGSKYNQFVFSVPWLNWKNEIDFLGATLARFEFIWLTLWKHEKIPVYSTNPFLLNDCRPVSQTRDSVKKIDIG